LNGSDGFNFPNDVNAISVIEIEGVSIELDRQQGQIISLCEGDNAREVRHAASDGDRDKLWKCRKKAIPAVGRISPTYLIDDCIVPRTRLPEMLRKIAEIGAKRQVSVLNVAHAGDGNIHPVIVYDGKDQASIDRAIAAGKDILAECIALGGSITAEHGIGSKKADALAVQFQDNDLEAIEQVRYSFDPHGRFNPGKITSSMNP
jgi:glycolate oxidase